MGPDDHGALLTRGFGRALVDEDLGGAAFADIEAVEPLLEDIEGGVRRMDLDALFGVQGRHPDIGLTRADVELDAIAAPPGEGRELGLARQAEPEEVAPSELDLGLAVRRHEIVARGDGEVHLGGFGPEIRSPVNRNVALDEAQPGVAPAVPFVRLGEGRERDEGREDRENRSEHQGFSHLLSPHAPFKGKNRARRSQGEPP